MLWINYFDSVICGGFQTHVVDLLPAVSAVQWP